MMDDMPSTAVSEYTPIERHVLLAWWLATGDRLNAEQVARRFRIKQPTAMRMLDRISRKLPIYCDECGNWQAIMKTR